MLQFLFLSAASALAATTISESFLFKGFRQWVKSKSDYLGTGVSCGYCMSHWTALFFTVLYHPHTSWQHFLPVWLTMAFISAFLWSALMFITKPHKKLA